jgi:hypothetical protein
MPQTKVDVRKVSNRVARMGRNHRFTSLEIERFVADVGVASRRLASREYQQSSFQPRNALRIPDRTDELFQDLTFYWSVGQVWRTLFEAISLHPSARIAEIGCGYVPKVAIGLHYFGAHGQVDLIDADAVALEHAKRFLELMGARFPVGAVKGALSYGVVGEYDAVFANHLLDDLILSHFCERRNIDIAKLYGREESYIAVWREIVTTPDLLNELVPALAEVLVRSVRTGGLVVLLDYPSFSHRALGLNDVVEFVRTATRLLRENVRAKGAVIMTGIPSTSITIDRMNITQDDIVACRVGGGDGEL